MAQLAGSFPEPISKAMFSKYGDTTIPGIEKAGIPQPSLADHISQCNFVEIL